MASSRRMEGKVSQGTYPLRPRTAAEFTVADGVIFPIVSAMSNFVVHDPKQGRWMLQIPPFFDEVEIDAARGQLVQKMAIRCSWAETLLSMRR